MRNTLLLQLPGVRKLRLYYIAVLMLLCLLIGTACPAYAEETADSSSSSTSDTTDDDLSLGGDITDAYDKYAGGVDSGLDDIKEQYDGVVNDSVLGLQSSVQGVQEVRSGRAGVRALRSVGSGPGTVTELLRNTRNGCRQLFPGLLLCPFPATISQKTRPRASPKPPYCSTGVQLHTNLAENCRFLF